ncbi:phage holin family protein [Metabacillus herbersteinensis]|uniref:Phage holin family protein n=1 Tax=Metabacillus herbersteinensis TaxID=283816 RepID=A0ABV6GD96_9BACI
MLDQLFNQVSVNPQLIIVVPALMILGYALKKTPNVEDWMIIWIILFCGIIASVFTLGFSVNGVANGVIAAGAAITTHQMVKQSLESLNTSSKKQNQSKKHRKEEQK